MSEFCKFYKQKKQYSIDSGPWSDVLPYEYKIGDAIGESSICQDSLITRYHEIEDFVCENGNKYAMNLIQYSYDNGNTWKNYYPLIYELGRLLESDSELCNNKWEGHYLYTGGTICPEGYIYQDGRGCVPAPPILRPVDPIKYIRCGSTTDTILNALEVAYDPYILYEGIIGDCVTQIEKVSTGTTGAFQGQTTLSSITIGNNVTTIGQSAFEGCTNLSSITIPDSVTTIEWYAFEGCTSLSSITIGNSVTAIKDYAFSGCTSLSSITIPDNVTSIDTGVFANCTSLSSITIPDNVTSIGSGVFRYCTSLSSITIPNSVGAIMERTFYECTSLTSITIPDSVTYIGIDAFYNCTSLKSVEMPSSIRTISNNAFERCSGLTSITINAINPPTLGNAYESVFDETNNCPIYVPCKSVDTYKSTAGWSSYRGRIRAIPYAEYEKDEEVVGEYICEGRNKYKKIAHYLSQDNIEWCLLEYHKGDLIEADSNDCTIFLHIERTNDSYTKYCYETTSTRIEINDIPSPKAEITAVVIGPCVTRIASSYDSWSTGVFEDCTNLTSVTISDSVTDIGSKAFVGCTSLPSITIPNSVTYISTSAFEYCSSLTSVTIPNSVTYISTFAFHGCTRLPEVTIPDSVTSINEKAFQNCYALTSVTIGNGVRSINNRAFYWCTGLTSVTVEAATPPTLGREVFTNTRNCPIYVPAASVNAYKKAWSSYASRIAAIEPPYKLKYTLEDNVSYILCDASTTLTSSETSPYSAMTNAEIGNCVVTIGDSAFSGCTYLTSVTIPNSVTSIGERAFRGCSGLTSVTIPDSVTSISRQAFLNCSGLTNVTISNSVTSIGERAFYGCSSLTSIDIPNSVTSIGGNAFQYCSGLTSVTIGSGVTSIGSWAFNWCTGLTSITVEALTPTTLGNNAVFNNTNDCPIYVPAASVDAYKAASGWSEYADRIQPIPNS